MSPRRAEQIGTRSLSAVTHEYRPGTDLKRATDCDGRDRASSKIAACVLHRLRRLARRIARAACARHRDRICAAHVVRHRPASVDFASGEIANVKCERNRTVRNSAFPQLFARAASFDRCSRRTSAASPIPGTLSLPPRVPARRPLPNDRNADRPRPRWSAGASRRRTSARSARCHHGSASSPRSPAQSA